MTVDVSPKFVATTRTKASLTRPAIDLEEDPWSEGVPAANITYIADYWANNYEWFDIQKQLNENFKHFTTTVGPLSLPNSTFKDPIPLHFVHHRSSRTDAIPLLFIHGWPGSFLEVERILPGLLNPPSPSDPAFHVVAPSIPGFGFSPAPRRSGFGLIETGAAFNELMHQLGYGRYVVQGGDFGSHTSRYMGAMFPESVVSILANLWGAHPNASDLERFQQNLTSPEEASFIKSDEASAPFVEAFWGIQRAVPLQIGMLLGDSPVGNVAWPYLGMVGMTPGYNWPVEEIITWAMMLYIQGPYGSVRIYKELGRVSPHRN
jgi:pimeloyl-ACP methyl ester carboxylesterase